MAERKNDTARKGQMSDPYQTPICAEFHRTIELIGKRWTGAILAALMQGPLRFNEILSNVPGLSDRLLTERLRELEGEGIVERKVFAERPVRIEYQLSAAGLDLDQIIKVVSAWGLKWQKKSGAPASANRSATKGSRPAAPSHAKRSSRG
ncbi:MAG: helix-turn-helix domain-containing protein [Pseudomonadota bacterium]